MNSQNSDSVSNATWFVGASFGGTDDQTQRFLAEQGYGYIIKDADDLLGPAI